MDYILKASLVLFIFYACYQLLLQKETFFQANRWFLLFGLIITCVIPLIVIPVYMEYTVSNTNSFILNYDTLTTPVALEEPFDYMQLIIWIYLAGILFFFGKLIVAFLSLRKVINSSKTKSLGSFKLLETNRNITPFSFFDRIVYNPNQFRAEELEHIINHEKVHIKQWHSIDTIISHIACILFWFNPIAWLYKRALQQNLEFIADQNAQHISLCEKSYQTVLLKTSLQNNQLAITNNFYTSLIKKRIVMLHQSKSRNINKLKMVFVMPLLGLFMMSFNTEDVYVEISGSSAGNVEFTNQIQDHLSVMFSKDNDDNYLALTKIQLYEKGITFNCEDLKRNGKNEIIAIKVTFESSSNSTEYKVSGKKPIQPFTFQSDGESFNVATIGKDDGTFWYTKKDKDVLVRTKDGKSVSNKKTDSVFTKTQGKKLIQERDSILANDNSKNQTWISKDGTKTNINASENGSTYTYSSQGEEPLYIVNGKEVDKNHFKELKPDNIESMSVLKDKSATALYGERAKNGVIMITTKSKGPWKIVSSEVTKYPLGKPNDTIMYRLVTPNESGMGTQYHFTPSKIDDKDLLFIVDGVKGTQRDFRKVTPDLIKSMNVIKKEEGLKVYGEKGKNGVIIIETKSGNQSNRTNNSKIIEVKKDSPWKVTTTQVTGVYYTGDNEEKSAELVISKTSTDSFLEKQKQELKKHGIDAKFSKVRRNKAGVITGIKISLNDDNGRKSNASWKGEKEGIPDIIMGTSKDDSLVLREIGDYFTTKQ
ncbi:MAG: bla regulator protein BlaR1 [Psychroserpens sp.]|jgi:bla regulator protein BlaR1|uniref:M56 family metallopeptidase n=1 Tax=Psychroserpens sp. TaxID=2020870 RepID=UPI0039E5EC28